MLIINTVRISEANIQTLISAKAIKDCFDLHIPCYLLISNFTEDVGGFSNMERLTSITYDAEDELYSFFFEGDTAIGNTSDLSGRLTIPYSA